MRTPRKHRRSFYEDSDTEDQDQVVAVSSEDSEDHSTEEEEEEDEEEEEADDRWAAVSIVDYKTLGLSCVWMSEHVCMS